MHAFGLGLLSIASVGQILSHELGDLVARNAVIRGYGAGPVSACCDDVPLPPSNLQRNLEDWCTERGCEEAQPGFAVKLFMASVSIYTMLFFDKYRATAQAFISCAQGAAGMAGQALLSSLEETYGFAGALAIFGGILLHAVPLSMLLKEAHRIRCVKCVVIADQVGTERTAACWGISGLAIIPLSLANPVIIGFFRDAGGSYDNFYRMLSGINLFVTIQFALYLVCRKPRKSVTEDNRL
ncbi:hypothetical protein HPB52_018379 [Rhipicephalus sanguineus]|uniref:Uncharacterized protein n=1 Tax=Rhipicephalus sanguineus TaxID=34632 RepID=A0A9D4PX51_RHISA|nr:hypothetical protein HPB52_018379 [Rhipicephalus sanguineus]